MTSRAGAVIQASDMAASMGVSRLHMRGNGQLLKCFRRILTPSQRRVGTSAEACQPLTVHQDAGKSFLTLQEESLERAERSVLISCPSKTSEKKILKFLSKYGTINNCFFYDSYGSYAVVEFASRDGISSLHGAASLPNIQHEASVPFKSRLLTLKSNGVDLSDGPTSLKLQPQTSLSVNELIQRLAKEESIDQQLHSLTSTLELTNENIALRFLVCSLLKDVAGAFFPECTIRLFGSSVNGFGKLGCDLDLFLDLDTVSGRSIKRPSGLAVEYQTKRVASERTVTQSVLSVVGEGLEQFAPGCVGVQKILNARCPLVRFSHQPSGFQCDLTANNRVAMKSSELLWLLSRLDERVRCLVFMVRCWARAHGLTSSIPGAWITNFSLSTLVVFFLQTRSPPILPTLEQLRELASPADKCVIEGNDCTMVSDLSKIQLKPNTEPMETLLQEFFEFYSTFAFNRMSINIRKGMHQHKPEAAPLHIQNPFEAGHNVSKNVNTTQLERLVALCRESAWLLAHGGGTIPPGTVGAAGAKAVPWGIAALLMPSVAEAAGVKGRKKKKREPASERIKNLLQSLNKPARK
ncbi:poly(A) RNA polymerase, mitochondrial [Clupea harengus]|uniref:Poly(A) RNA polymerase, mitochondrial n=1 Tax=Clupea harengus TaxID=7950 RepID=A0A6P3VS46_CLUHA|nr:poly(A) RNA polymerase, mitochondrial [Clupea harengus]